MSKKACKGSAGKVKFNEAMNEFASESLSASEQKQVAQKAKQALDSFEKSNF